MYGVILALHHDGRLLKSVDSAARARAAFARLIDSDLNRLPADGDRADATAAC